MIRIGFPLVGRGKWTGGLNYLLNILRAISIHERDRLTPFVFVGTDIDARELCQLRALNGVELVVSGAWTQARLRAGLASAIVFGRAAEVYREMRSRRIDVFFEPARYFGWRAGIPMIAWVPDLQHRALRHLWPRGQWWKRELGIRAQVASGRMVMLSSESARCDFERMYPASIGRTRVVRFAVLAGIEIDDERARSIVASYSLPERYFFLPNQFWRHKNHLLVLDALVALKKRGREVVVVATGRADDLRSSGYFHEISRRVQLEGHADRFRYLGMLPYEHLAPILGASTALLNPSLFEGWSTTVEEARGLGVPMILSDLPVHREQMGDAATYFDPHDAESLASALESFAPICTSERRRRALVARQDVEDRYRAFASKFADLCEEAVSGVIASQRCISQAR
jgi:glycosyltransferase involved in cell wall biosynthesis